MLNANTHPGGRTCDGSIAIVDEDCFPKIFLVEDENHLTASASGHIVLPATPLSIIPGLLPTRQCIIPALDGE
jgi:hypothetical protein